MKAPLAQTQQILLLVKFLYLPLVFSRLYIFVHFIRKLVTNPESLEISYFQCGILMKQVRLLQKVSKLLLTTVLPSSYQLSLIFMPFTVFVFYLTPKPWCPRPMAINPPPSCLVLQCPGGCCSAEPVQGHKSHDRDFSPCWSLHTACIWLY